jgi:hypothetical protein
VNRSITGFHQDPEGHWVADLECGHGQHVRHDPPWQVREWVLSDDSRCARLGSTLHCVFCDQELARLSAKALEAYNDALVQGLCHAGALEVARRALWS